MALRLTRTPSPFVVAVVGVVAGLVFVAVRFAVAADGDITRFLVAGSLYVDPGATPVVIEIVDGPGYDGQFQWRLAADPTDLGVDEHLGVTLDGPMRSQRIGYPALGWLFAGGQAGLVAWSLVAVNLLAVAVIAGVGAALARDEGRTPWWGLVLASVPGFVFVLARDLTELTAAAALLVGVLAVRRRQWWAAAMAWSAAVVTREQLVIAVAAYGLLRLLEVRKDRRFGATDLPWLIPAFAFLAWQGVVRIAVGEVAGSSGVGPHIGWPLVGFVEALGDRLELGDASARTRVTAGTWVLEVTVLIGLVGAVFRRSLPATDRWIRVAVGLLGAFVLLLTDRIWGDPADLRTMTDLFVLGWVAVIIGPPTSSARPLVVVQGSATVFTLGLLAVSI